jgi:hypothetical protein
VPSLRRDTGRLDPSAPYASGLGRRARRGARGRPADRARLIRGGAGYKAPRGAGVGKARGVGADAEASGRGATCARERVLGRIKFGVPMFERVELQKFEQKCAEW